jgi:hypothetical protein
MQYTLIITSNDEEGFHAIMLDEESNPPQGAGMGSENLYVLMRNVTEFMEAREVEKMENIFRAD